MQVLLTFLPEDVLEDALFASADVPTLRALKSTFRGCSSLTTIELPAGLTSIGEFAFYRCSSMTSIELPIGLASLGGYAFRNCSSLTLMELPASLTSIGEW